MDALRKQEGFAIVEASISLTFIAVGFLFLLRSQAISARAVQRLDERRAPRQILTTLIPKITSAISTYFAANTGACTAAGLADAINATKDSMYRLNVVDSTRPSALNPSNVDIRNIISGRCAGGTATVSTTLNTDFSLYLCIEAVPTGVVAAHYVLEMTPVLVELHFFATRAHDGTQQSCASLPNPMADPLVVGQASYTLWWSGRDNRTLKLTGTHYGGKI